jgi:hypothetical protein
MPAHSWLFVYLMDDDVHKADVVSGTAMWLSHMKYVGCCNGMSLLG